MIGVFGNRAALSLLEKKYDLMVPSVVMEELLEHSKQVFYSQRDSIRKNYYAVQFMEEFNQIQRLEFDDFREELVHSETISYQVVNFENSELFMERFLERAIKHLPPFEEKSDKGFKDACIAHIVDTYVASHGKAILITSDRRVAQYFAGNDLVIVVRDEKELKAYENEERALVGDERAAAEGVNSEDRMDAGFSIDSDKKEIERLINAKSFAETHSAIAKLRERTCTLTMNEEREILRAAASNDQMLRIITDGDSADFIMPPFNKHSDCLSDSQYNVFVDSAELPNNRLNESGYYQMSRKEKLLYSKIVNGLVDRLISRSYDSAARHDYDEMLFELKELLRQSAIDENLLVWNKLARVFVSNGVVTANGLVNRSLLEGFVRMLDLSSKEKRDEVMRRVGQRIDESDFDITFGIPPF